MELAFGSDKSESFMVDDADIVDGVVVVVVVSVAKGSSDSPT